LATLRRKKAEPFSVFQRDPGPWPPILLNWMATLAIIMVFGLVMLFSASYTTGYLRFGDSFHYIKSQLLCTVLGLGMMFLFSYFDHRFLRRMVKLGYVVCLILLVLVLFSSPINGCRRWISFGGLTLQASEVAKFEMILLTADIAARTPQIKFGEVPLRKWVHHSIVVELIRPILWLVPVLILLVLEPHMSGILLTTAIVGTILLLGGSGGIITWGCAGAALFLLETLLKHVDSIDYLQSRLDGWTQDLDRMTSQTKQSLYAIGSGGATGLGLGNSRQKHLFVPEPQNDFIFSIVCEELGFVGACAVVLLFVLLLWRGITIAAHAPDRFGALLVVGFTVQVALQAVLNVAVVTNTIPNTGISLPFFSSGGTSLMMLLGEMGIVLSVSRGET
jgi:cell division protein FtsW